MKSYKTNFTCALILLILMGCRQLVTDEFDDMEKVVVINSIIEAQHPIKVHLSYSTNLGADYMEIIENACVLIYEDDVFVDTLDYISGGYYLSNVNAEEGKNYSCSLNVLDETLAETPLSIAQKILNVKHINAAGKTDEGITHPAIEVTFSNDTNEELYFEIMVLLQKEYRMYHDYGEYDIVDSVSAIQLLNITDPLILNEGIPLLLFSNELITQDYYTMHINYTTGESQDSDDDYNTYEMVLYPFTVELRTVSKDYYLYMKQKYIYEQGRYPEVFGDVARAYSLYSNVTNGLGIFAGYSCSLTDTIVP